MDQRSEHFQNMQLIGCNYWVWVNSKPRPDVYSFVYACYNRYPKVNGKISYLDMGVFYRLYPYFFDHHSFYHHT